MRHIRIFSVLLLLLPDYTSSFAQKAPLPAGWPWIAFEWEGTTLGTRHFDKAAIEVPFSIDGIKDRFFLQLDLGATCSMLYGNGIDPYLAKNRWLAAKLDTVHKKYLLEGQLRGGFNELHAHLGTQPVILGGLAYFAGYGDTITEELAKAGRPMHLGTLGAPFFSGKVLVIDYPGKRFGALDSLDAATAGAFEWVDCRLEDYLIKIPFTIGGVTYWLMFDTGSSLFPMVTNKKYYDAFTGDTPVDSLPITNWGRTVEVYDRRMNTELLLGRVRLPASQVYMVPGSEWDEFFKSEGIIGITGNACFLDRVVAIDFRRRRFGVAKAGVGK